MFEKFKKKLIFLALLAGLTSSLVVTTSSPSLAQAINPIDTLETEVAKLSDVYDTIVPVAVGATVFAMGMLLIKRVAYA